MKEVEEKCTGDGKGGILYNISGATWAIVLAEVGGWGGDDIVYHKVWAVHVWGRPDPQPITALVASFMTTRVFALHLFGGLARSGKNIWAVEGHVSVPTEYPKWFPARKELGAVGWLEWDAEVGDTKWVNPTF